MEKERQEKRADRRNRINRVFKFGKRDVCTSCLEIRQRKKYLGCIYPRVLLILRKLGIDREHREKKSRKQSAFTLRL